MKLFIKILIGFVAIFIVYCFMSSQLIISPARLKSSDLPSDLGLPYENIILKTSDDIGIKGWFIHHSNAKGNIIVCHGWGSDKADCLDVAQFLWDNGYNVLLFDFRGHGESEGKYCSLGYYERKDLIAAIKYLRQQGETRIGAIGFSMGGTVALMVEAEVPELVAVVAESPYLSFIDVVTSFTKLHWKSPKHPFIPITVWTAGLRLGFSPREVDLRKFVEKISPKPLFIIYGAKDKEVPPFHARKIFEYAKEPKEIWEIPEARHLEAYFVERKEYERRVLNFFDNAFSQM